MAFKRTLFNKQWLDPVHYPDFSGWLREGADEFHGYCSLCKKTFSLGNMGRKAVTTHSKGQNHIKMLNLKSTNSSLKTFFKKPASESSSEIPNQENSAQEVCSTPSSSTSGTLTSIESFCYKDEVTTAEIKWALSVIQNKLSLNSCENISETFKEMFPDSTIASKFQLGRTKCSYVINYGLAPYFHNLLQDEILSCDNVVICFDEALNKVVQRGQMDLFVRYFDINSNKVQTRYFNSIFMGHATSQDILEAFNQGISPIARKSILQVSMDGPNVNLSFIKKFGDQLREDDNANGKKLVDLGVCGLHVINGALKTGVNSVKWDLQGLLRDMYYLLNNCPARRAEYTSITGSTTFPMKYCTTRWLENVTCVERALMIIDHMAKFVTNIKALSSKPFQSVSNQLKDKFIKCKLAFFKVIASECEPFLRKFQSPDPLAPYLFSELQDLLRTLLSRCVKPSKLAQATTSSKLLSIDLHDLDIMLELSKINLGFQATKYLKEIKGNEKEILQFRKECQTLLINTIEKLIERSPLKYKVVRGLSALNPVIILKKPDIAISRMTCLLEELFNSNRITDNIAEKAKSQFALLVLEVKEGCLKELFKSYEEQSAEAKVEKRLDTFYSSFMAKEKKFEDLWVIVKLALIFSHGNASVEGGFSINKSILVENLQEETLVSQRRVHNAICYYGGIHKVPISHKMLLSVRAARKRYEDGLKVKRECMKEEEKARAAKRKLTSEIRKLEDERKKLRIKSQYEEEDIQRKIQQLEKHKKEV